MWSAGTLVAHLSDFSTSCLWKPYDGSVEDTLQSRGRSGQEAEHLSLSCKYLGY